MTCAEFDAIVHDLARPETLDKPAAVIAKFHARTCERCAARLVQAQFLALALDATAEHAAHLETPSHLESALVSSFREHHRSLARTKHRQRRALVRRLEWSALAAAAMVFLAIGAWHFSRPRIKISKPAGAVAFVPPAPPASSTNIVDGNGAQPLAAQAAVADSAAAQSDLASEFVPVPDGEGFSPGDSGVIVRVEMRRSALADLGYSVDAAHAADMVQADLLVGDDGWPRAVRLVQ